MNPFKVGDYVCWKNKWDWKRYCENHGYVFKSSYKIVKIEGYRIFFEENTGLECWSCFSFKEAEAPLFPPLEHYLQTEQETT